MPLPNNPNKNPLPGQGRPQPRNNGEAQQDRRDPNAQRRNTDRQGQQRPNPRREERPELNARSAAGVSPDVAKSQFNEKMRQAGRTPQGEVINQYDNDEDGTFETLSVDEQIDYDMQEEEEARRRAAKRQAAERRAQKKAEEIRAQKRAEIEREIQQRKKQQEEEILFDNFDDSESDSEEEVPEPVKAKKSDKKDMFEDNVKDEYGQDVFIDEKEEKLLPFGTKKGKKQRTKEYQYDDRKNLRTSANIVRGIIVVGLSGLLILGAKNTFFPEPAMTEEDIVSTIQSTVNITDFPLERGEGFAKDFTQAYLSTDPDNTTTNSEVLGYFYNGSIEGAGGSTARVVDSDYKNSVIYGPTVYEAVALTDYSARYTIGAVVKPESAPVAEGEQPVEEKPKWIFVNVNVYYDAAVDSFAITPDSPTVVPSSAVKPPEDIPEAELLGEETTDEATLEKVKPVLYGFLTGYRETTPEDHTKIDQYIIGDAPPSLLHGLSSEYDFAGEGAEDSVEFTVYEVTEEPGTLKVRATVNWATKNGTDAEMQLTSTYVATLQEQSNGMYLVSQFQPLYFVQDEEAVAAAAAQEAAAETE